jgi:hypothetical protein
MKTRIAAIAFAMLVPVQFARGTEKAQPPAVGSARSAAVLEVSALMREAEKYNKGLVRVEGVVSRVYPKDQKLGLMDHGHRQ